MSGGASAALRRKPELAAEDALAVSPPCTLTTPCHYTERTPIAHVREKVTTWSGQPLYSEFFELRSKSSLPPLSSSPLHRCRLASASEQLPSPAAAAAGDPARRLLHRTDCIYGHVPGGGAGGFAAATMAASGRARCHHHDLAVSPRRAVSTDRLLAGKDVAVEVVSGASHGHGGAASPDILPGSDLESLVITSTQ